ncbi:MAG TPA: M23 family metallopeptidase [Actinomycetota bacterium]|nr:M23 family metallopeptidase [Actinomycetota bacterium]
MQARRTHRAHLLFVIAFLAAPTIAMLPAGALEQKTISQPPAAIVPIPAEHVDVIATPERATVSRAKPHVVRRAHVARPRRTSGRSSTALRVGFTWPVTKAAITSPFGWRPFVVLPGEKGPHPAREFHHGADISCAIGQPVVAAKGGRVVLSGVDPEYGNVIVIAHAGGWQTLYGHLSKRLVNAGTSVSSRALIGLCGMTGRATGPHLHFGISRNGHWYNPLKFLP